MAKGRAEERMSSDDEPIRLRLPKCPSCGRFRIACYGLLMDLGDGHVKMDDDFTWWCLDCGHRRGDPLPDKPVEATP